jgi:hypothetical protein
MKIIHELSLFAALLSAGGCTSPHQTNMQNNNRGYIGCREAQINSTSGLIKVDEPGLLTRVYDVRGSGPKIPEMMQTYVSAVTAGDGNQSHKVEIRGDRLVITTTEPIHGYIRRILAEIQEGQSDQPIWVLGKGWAAPFEKTVVGTTEIQFGHKIITDPAEIQRFIEGMQFRDSYTARDWEMRFGPEIVFRKDGRDLARLSYVTYDQGVRLDWRDGWKGCATLTPDSSALFMDMAAKFKIKLVNVP